MNTTRPIEQLATLSRSFGPSAAAKKLQLLKEITDVKARSARQLVLLHDTLYFMRAYPDSAAVLRSVESCITLLRGVVEKFTGGSTRHASLLNTGVPGSCNAYAYSYAVLQRLTEKNAGGLEFDWEDIDDQSPLTDALVLTIAPGELRGLEDEFVTLREWLQNCKPGPGTSDLEVVLRLFRESALDPQQQMHVFETCNLPVAYELSAPGSGRCEVSMQPLSFFFQQKPIRRERFPLRSRIVRPVKTFRRLSPTAGRVLIDLSLSALCSRNLEIYPLIYANVSDVTVVDCRRGFQVALAGMLPEFRPALESLLFFLILKNGVPIAYGPACIANACCEMGINLFPEFRGGEIRYLYAQFMRSLYHLAGVRYFFLTSYGMGENNEEALRSGAFWFYRKMGFRASNPEVEALARKEEKIMANNPGYRSPIPTLRRLSHTEAYFDLSGGLCRPADFEALGAAVTRHITKKHGGSRARAHRSDTRRLVRVLGIRHYDAWDKSEKNAMEQLAPVIVLLPRLESWTARDKRSLAALIKAKGAPGEFGYVKRLSVFSRLREALRAAATGERESEGRD